MPVLEVLFAMERNGVLLDYKLLHGQSRELGEKLQVLEQQAHAIAEQPFNLNSPKQIQEILFNQLKLPVIKKTPTGVPSTDEDVLQQLALDYPLPKLLLARSTRDVPGAGSPWWEQMQYFFRRGDFLEPRQCRSVYS